eukprot:gene26790-biopygen17357
MPREGCSRPESSLNRSCRPPASFPSTSSLHGLRLPRATLQ